MNIKSLVNNKFITAIPVALLLFGCLYKFNEFRDINKEEPTLDGEKNEEPTQYDIKYYIKSILICYLLGIVFVILITKGYNYYINGTSANISITNKDDLIPKEEPYFNKEEAIVRRENELQNDIKELNVDIDTSNLESIEIPTLPPRQSNVEENKSTLLSSHPVEKSKVQSAPSYPKDNSLETKKTLLLEKRKKLLALKNQPKKPKKIEQFQTGTPNF